MSLTASVVSAAILEGNLIIGLSDGSVINCGYVQGPPGLKGDAGPMGASGESGRDGNTIHTVAGTPRNDMGVDGDYAIDNINWRIYGPKSGGIWGKANDMLPSKDNLIANGRAPSASGGGGGGDSSTDGGAARVYNTGNLRLTGTGKSGSPFVEAPGGNIIPEGTGLKFQANANGWFVDSLQALDTALPIDKVTELPDAGKYQGDMVLYKDALWIYHGKEWIEVGGAVNTDGLTHVEVGETAPDKDASTTGDMWFNSAPTELTLYIFDGTDWIPAAPPVSLDGIEQNVEFLGEVTGQLNKEIKAIERVTHDQANRIDALEKALGGSGEADPRLPYRLGTDKAAKAGIASIELVDAEDNYSNVHLTGINGIKTESTINGINIDGSGLLTKAPTEKYDGTFTYISDLPTAKLEPGQIIFTNDSDVPTELPSNIANIHLSLDGFDWDDCTESGSVKIVNSSGVLAGYFIVLDRDELENRNMKLLVSFVNRTGSGGSISVTTDCIVNFRNVFLA